MSIQAGDLIYIGGNAVIDRLQSAGLGQVKVPTETIREIGNFQIVDKVPGEPDFTFTMESFDVSPFLEAWLTGEVGDGTIAGAPGATDITGTTYQVNQTTCQFVNICSPWVDPTTGSASTVNAGHLIPGYYPKRIRYQYGVTANASEQVELQGGAFYYATHAPVEQYFTGNGSTVTFTTGSAAVPYREGGAGGTVFRSIFGVCIDGQLQAQGVDYTTTPTNSASPATASITFTVAPKAGAIVKFSYFTTVARAFPQAVHAAASVKPAAVRGRNICAYIGSGSAKVLIPMVQSFSLEYTVQGTLEHEFCNAEVVGYNITGTDVNGDLVTRARDATQFFTLLSQALGVASSEVLGWLNTYTVPLSLEIHDPKNPANIIKTLYVNDAIFDPPDTPAKVNSPTDFTFGWSSQSGTYEVIKAQAAP